MRRDNQLNSSEDQNDMTPGQNVCPRCGKIYKYNFTLIRHVTYECGKLPRFVCNYCPYRAKRRSHMTSHIRMRHRDKSLMFYEDTMYEEWRSQRRFSLKLFPVWGDTNFDDSQCLYVLYSLCFFEGPIKFLYIPLDAGSVWLKCYL